LPQERRSNALQTLPSTGAGRAPRGRQRRKVVDLMREDSDSRQLRFDLADSPVKPTPAILIDQIRRKGLIMQIARDMAVLREDPVYHQPSREFFVERIAAYRAELRAGDVPRP
jgi:hypothetical protein